MSTIDVRLPDGRLIRINGANSDDEARAAVNSMLQEERRNAPRTGSSLARGVDELQGSLYSAVEGLGRATGIGLFERFGREGRERNEAEAEQSLPSPQRQTFGDAETAGDYVRAAGQALGTNLPNLGASLGAMAAGAAIAGPPGAIAGGLLASYPQLFGANRQRQMEANPNQPVDEGAAALTAVPQAALDLVSDRILFGLGRALGAPTREAGQAALTRIARGLGLGAAAEVPTEVAQAALERAQAGLDIFSQDAMREYGETAAGAMVVGGTAGATIAGVAGPRPQVTPVRTQEEQEPIAQTPPEEFGPTAPSLPPEPPPVEDLDTARQVLARDNIALPRDIDEAGIVAMANLSERARYRDQVAQVRDNEVARFTGLRDVIVRPGEPNAEGVADDTADFTRAAPTLIRNVLSAMQSGAIEGERFTPRQVIGLAVEGLGLEASAVPRGMQTVVTQYLDGLAQAGYLNKTGKSYEINLRTREPQGARAVDGNLTTEERSAQAVLPLLQTYQNNPTNANRQAAERAARGTQLETEVSNFFTLQQERQGYINERNALTQKPALTEQESEDLRNLEADIATTSTNLARIVDSLEGRAQGRAIAMPGEAPQFSDQVGRSQPAVDPNEQAFNQEFAREMNAAAASTVAPALSNPNVQVDDTQIANAIMDRPQEARDLVQSLASAVPPGTPFRAADIVNAARARGIPLTPQNGVQLYNIARMAGVVDRNGATRPQAPTNLAVAQGFAPTGEQLGRAANIQGAEEVFKRMVGTQGRIRFQDKILMSDLDAETQRLLAEQGITDINVNGVATADLAILSLANPELNLRDTAIHEGFHVADYLGLITPNERAILDANADKILALIKDRWPNETWGEIEGYITNNPAEIRAWGINARVAQNLDFGSTINRILDKIAQFIERIGNALRGRGFTDWRQIYDRLYAGDFANRQAQPGAIPIESNFARATTATPSRTQATHRAAKDELTGLLRWFGSPIMTIGKVLPNHRAAADTQKQLYTRSNEMINETESLIEAAYRLPPQSVAKITRVWNEASRKRQAPNLSGLNAAERDALRQQMAATQRGLDYMIESMVLDNFLPNQTKNPAVRQRLEAFWNRHQDKHLWEIPQRELMAASPEGYREMQRLERLRNPYYMPMVGRGSHFVAAYQRKPNGDRGKLVGLVAYEPLTIRQKLLRKWNRAENPEQAAILQLQNEFNDPRKYIVMQNGVQFTNDSQAEQIRAQGDFIAQYMEKVRQAASATGNTKVLETVRAMTAQMDKAQLERIFRPNNDILRAVTPQNESSYILDVMPQYLLSLAKVQARRYTQEGFKEATKNMTPNDREYWSTTRDYATSPSEAFGNLRALAFFQYLGFALDTALINLTQNLHTNAMLTRDGGLVGSKIFAQVAGRMGVNADAKTLTDPSGFVKNYITKHASPNEKIALERAMEQGIFAPVFTNESRSQFTVEGLRRAGFKNPQKMHQRFTKLSQWAGLPMQFVEAYNRAVVFAAAYKLAEQNPSVIARANQVDGTQYANPYDYAVGKVIDTQFLTTKEDRALFQRFTPAAELATQFLSYPFKAMEQYARAGVQTIKGMAQSDPVMARAGAINLLLMMGPLIMLAGVFALPFADFAKELAEDLVGVVWGSPQNFEMDMREMLGGGRGAEFVLGGGLQAAGIATLRRRLALDPIPYNDLLSINTVGNLFGPVGSMIEIPQNAYQYYQNGDYMQMAASLMPRAAGNVVRGAQIAIEEQQYTRRGNRVITPETVQEAGNLFGGVLPANISAGARAAFGFAPPEFAREREIVSTAEELSRATRSRSERYSKELARILVNMLEAQRNNNMDEAAGLGQQYGDRLREISEAELQRPAHLQVMPNHQSVLRRALRDFYGIGSEEALGTTGRRNAREEVLRQRALIDWRNQQN